MLKDMRWLKETDMDFMVADFEKVIMLKIF